jgi:hypothetical protein
MIKQIIAHYDDSYITFWKSNYHHRYSAIRNWKPVISFRVPQERLPSGETSWIIHLLSIMLPMFGIKFEAYRDW